MTCGFTTAPETTHHRQFAFDVHVQSISLIPETFDRRLSHQAWILSGEQAGGTIRKNVFPDGGSCGVFPNSIEPDCDGQEFVSSLVGVLSESHRVLKR